VYSVLKAIFNTYSSRGMVSLGNSIYLLDSGVVTSPLVRRGYLSYRRIIYER